MITGIVSSNLTPPQEPTADAKLQDASRSTSTRKWLAPRKVLSSIKHHKQQNVSESVTHPSAETRCRLHLACRFDPPLDFIVSLDKKFPESNTHCDSSGKYPIHFAAEWGASPSVIEFLALKNPYAAAFQDSCGKTPLHYMCEHYAKKCSMGNEGGSLNARMMKIAKVLCRAAPSSQNLVDSKGMNALEYAIEADADRQFIRCLHKLCQREWVKQKEEGMTHTTIENKLAQHFEDCKEVVKRNNAALDAALDTSAEKRFKFGSMTSIVPRQTKRPSTILSEKAMAA